MPKSNRACERIGAERRQKDGDDDDYQEILRKDSQQRKRIGKEKSAKEF